MLKSVQSLHRSGIYFVFIEFCFTFLLCSSEGPVKHNTGTVSDCFEIELCLMLRCPLDN